MKNKLIKRFFDITIAHILFIIILPLIAIIYMIVLIGLWKPAIFKQARPGLCGRPYNIYKFRTMRNLKDRNGNLLTDDKRLTGFRKFLIRASLYELPVLWNVLKGNMSLVGPRPLLIKYLDRYTPEQARGHEVKPGITGWAQINGRNAIS